MRSGNSTWADRIDLRPTMHPTTRDIAWAAGIYEGEASVFNANRVCKRSPYRSVAFFITQKDPWILRRLRDLFGGSVNTFKQGRYWSWRVSGPRAVGFLLTIFIFLSPRRQAQLKSVFGV